MPPKRLSIFSGAELEDEMVAKPAAPQANTGVVMVDENLLTKEEIQSAMPPHLKISVTDELVAKVNSIHNDPQIADTIRENFISYTHIMKEGRFKISSYLDAAAFVTYKMMGLNNQEAYARTFPDRMQRLRSEGADDKVISSYVSAFKKNKLVNLIMEQTLIAPWVLNQDVYQQAIFVQADLMINANSEKVRCEAANSILNALKQPEVKQIDLNIGVKESSGMDELKTLLAKVANQQQNQIENGATTKQIAHEEVYDRTAGAEDAQVG